MNQLEILKSANSTFIREHPSLKLLVLFGSRARGDADPSSDWDFAFLSDLSLEAKDIQPKPFWFPGSDIVDTLSGLAGISSDHIDLVDLNHCSDILAHFIARDGQVIYEKNTDEFSGFQQRVLKTSTELKKFRQSQRSQVLQALERWGV